MAKYTRQDAERDLLLMAQSEADGVISEWLAERPKSVQDLYATYNPNRFYRVKKDAPYRFTDEGCIVAIQSFLENGSVRALVLKDRTGHTGVTAVIDPRWLEPVSLDQAFPPEMPN